MVGRRAAGLTAAVVGPGLVALGEPPCCSREYPARYGMASKRNQTNPDAPPDWTLSQQQLTAIDLLVTGNTLQAVADAIGVQRYLQAHPERLQSPDFALVLEAFHAAFPCPPAPAQPPR